MIGKAVVSLERVHYSSNFLAAPVREFGLGKQDNFAGCAALINDRVVCTPGLLERKCLSDRDARFQDLMRKMNFQGSQS